ncbi:MAG: hypothetical protein U0470_10435 [Anaerolineae bacterium]
MARDGRRLARTPSTCPSAARSSGGQRAWRTRCRPAAPGRTVARCVDYDAALAAVAHPRRRHRPRRHRPGLAGRGHGRGRGAVHAPAAAGVLRGRAFAERPDRLRVPVARRRCRPSLDALVERLPAADPLPPLPTSGWRRP